MVTSLFEVYDPYTFFLNLSLNWFPVSLVGFLVGEFWFLGSSLFFCFAFILLNLCDEFSNFYSFGKMKSSLFIFVPLFLFLLLVNILGLLPYVFSCSSHFVFSLSLALPLWLSFFLLMFLGFPTSSFAHLVPSGTPFVLISFMSYIEGISMLIRPWSLSIRLMANMISGHLLMSLLGDCGFYVIFVQSFLFVFEFFVCFIQAFVFSALLTLYSGEV